jgi:hypothetical protein
MAGLSDVARAPIRRGCKSHGRKSSACASHGNYSLSSVTGQDFQRCDTIYWSAVAIGPFANQENLLELNRYGVMQAQVAREESTSEVPLDTNMYAPTSIVTLYKSRTPAQETIVRYRPPMPQSLTCMPKTPLPIHHHHRSISPQDKLPVLLAPSSSSTSLTPHHPIPGLGSSNPTTLSPNSAFSSSISTILKQLGRREDPALVFPKEEKLPLRGAKLPLRAKKFKLLVLVEKLWASISAREEVGIWEQAERKEEGEREGRVVVLLLLVVEVEVEGANGFTFWKMARDWRRWGEVVVIVVE